MSRAPRRPGAPRWRQLSHRVLAGLLTGLCLLSGAPLRADTGSGSLTLSQQPPADKNARPKKNKDDQDKPFLITADKVSQNQELDVITASGHVEIDQGLRTLLADQLTYHIKEDLITASGHVSLTEASGEVIFSEQMELTGDLKQAAARGVRVLLVDDSRIAAASARKINENREEFKRATYSPCEPCMNDKTKKASVLWSIKADKVSHNQETHKIYYENAWMDFAGVPVFYAPYLEHADPSIKRQSGLLPPSMVNNRLVGFGMRTPYYQTLGPNRDLTLIPLATTRANTMLEGIFRWQGASGESKTIVSAVHEPGRLATNNVATTGWHIDSRTRFDLSSEVRAGWEIQRASDRDYLSAYSVRNSSNQSFLKTHPWIEGYRYRSYAALEAYAFQNLTAAVPLNQTTSIKRPTILPLVTLDYVGDPGSAGEYISFATHMAAVNRDQGLNSRRVNTDLALHWPMTFAHGSVTNLQVNLRADAYNSDHVTAGTTGAVNSTRLQPQASLEWRYPLIRAGQQSSQVISPVVLATVAPHGGNSPSIPNEDALAFEIDESNIFSPTPFSGYDRLVSGPRLAYGVDYSLVDRGDQLANVILGQSYQGHSDSLYATGSGLDRTLSDIVGRLEVNPTDNVKTAYRFRIDKGNASLRRSEVVSRFGPRLSNLQLSYAFFDKLTADSPFGRRQQLSTTWANQWSRFWSTEAFTTNTLRSGNTEGYYAWGGRLIYDDECFQLAAEGGVRPTTVKAIRSGQYVLLRFNFKTLGQFPVNVW